MSSLKIRIHTYVYTQNGKRIRAKKEWSVENHLIGENSHVAKKKMKLFPAASFSWDHGDKTFAKVFLRYSTIRISFKIYHEKATAALWVEKKFIKNSITPRAIWSNLIHSDRVGEWKELFFRRDYRTWNKIIVYVYVCHVNRVR